MKSNFHCLFGMEVRHIMVKWTQSCFTSYYTQITKTVLRFQVKSEYLLYGDYKETLYLVQVLIYTPIFHVLIINHIMTVRLHLDKQKMES